MRQSLARKHGENQAQPRKKQLQLELDLFADPASSPADHLYALTGGIKVEDSIVWAPSEPEGNRWHVLKGTDYDALATEINGFRGKEDVYITVNEFHGWRRIALGANLNGFYMDFDCRDGQDPEFQRAVLLFKLEEDLNWPVPNMIVMSGRGFHAYWLFDAPVPFRALPRWQHCMRNIIKTLNGDVKAADATRVLRLVGTVNSKSGTDVTAIVWERSRYSFEYLFEFFADATYWQARNDPNKEAKSAQVRDIRPRQAQEGVKRKNTGSVYEYYYLIVCDLRWIVEHKFGGTVKKGSEARDWILFLYANALSWFTLSDALEDEILDIGRKITPSLRRDEVLAYTAQVRKRAKFDAEELAKDPHWKSNLWGSSRYRYTRKKLVQLFQDEGILTPDMYPHLRVFVPDEVIRERKTKREAQRYAAGKGGQVRAYGEANKGKREQAWILHRDGLSVRQIAEKLDVNPATISRWIRAHVTKSLGVAIPVL